MMTRSLMIVLAMLLLAAPALAAPSFKARLGGDKVFGTVDALSADGVTVTTPDGTVLVPTGRANYKLAGKRVKPEELTRGAAVEVDYKGMSGTVLGVNGNLVSFQPDKATAPIDLPMSFVRKSKVWVYTAKGDFVRVPIDEAIAMQATPNTTVLGPNAPERSGYDDGPSFGGTIFFGNGGGYGPWYGGGPWGGWGWGIGVRRGRW